MLLFSLGIDFFFKMMEGTKFACFNNKTGIQDAETQARIRVILLTRLRRVNFRFVYEIMCKLYAFEVFVACND